MPWDIFTRRLEALQANKFIVRFTLLESPIGSGHFTGTAITNYITGVVKNGFADDRSFKADVEWAWRRMEVTGIYHGAFGGYGRIWGVAFDKDRPLDSQTTWVSSEEFRPVGEPVYPPRPR